MPDAKRIINELKKLSRREQEFMFNFFGTKTGNKTIDLRNFDFDLDVYKYKNVLRMKRLFEPMYELNEQEVRKLAKQFGL